VKIVVTGGYGFIGSHFVEIAVQNGHHVIVIDKLTYAADFSNLNHLPRNSFQFIKTDIADFKSLELAFELTIGSDVGVLVNFAAESHVDRSIASSRIFLESNVLGVLNLLELQRHGRFTKLIQVSTDEIYGSIADGSWSENSPSDPRSPYSASKASAEHFCSAYRNTYGLDIMITRCCNNYGPRQSAEKFIPTVIRNILADRPIPIYGSGQNEREWVYVKDHALAILKIAESRQKSSVFNIGGTPLRNLDLANLIGHSISGLAPKIEYVEDRKGHDFRYSVNDELIRSELGWTPSVSLDEGLKLTNDWYSMNQEWLENSLKRSIL
jgi:dTDP-glucose 4,6-dehydratase